MAIITRTVTRNESGKIVHDSLKPVQSSVEPVTPTRHTLPLLNGKIADFSNLSKPFLSQNTEEQMLRSAYMDELKKAESSNCSNCERSAIINKYVNKYVALLSQLSQNTPHA